MTKDELNELRRLDCDELNYFLDYVRSGRHIHLPSREMMFCDRMTQRALLILADVNTGYHTPEENQERFEELTGRKVPGHIIINPPFFTDFGANIIVGDGVFINSGVSIQDQGGVTIDDGALIGHHVVIATINHDLDPSKRHDLIPKPIHIGKNAWIGSNSTILSGVTIGDGAVVAGGAVVTKDVPANTVVGGVPARIIRTV